MFKIKCEMCHMLASCCYFAKLHFLQTFYSHKSKTWTYVAQYNLRVESNQNVEWKRTRVEFRNKKKHGVKNAETHLSLEWPAHTVSHANIAQYNRSSHLSMWNGVICSGKFCAKLTLTYIIFHHKCKFYYVKDYQLRLGESPQTL